MHFLKQTDDYASSMALRETERRLAALKEMKGSMREASI
jgi:hypothetical protein